MTCFMSSEGNLCARTTEKSWQAKSIEKHTRVGHSCLNSSILQLPLVEVCRTYSWPSWPLVEYEGEIRSWRCLDGVKVQQKFAERAVTEQQRL